MEEEEKKQKKQGKNLLLQYKNKEQQGTCLEYYQMRGKFRQLLSCI